MVPQMVNYMCWMMLELFPPQIDFIRFLVFVLVLFRLAGSVRQQLC